MSCSAIGQNKNFAVIAYYAGDGRDLDSFNMRQLTHIIYSFCHLKGARLHVDNASDSAVIQKLVGYKKQHPRLKVLLSLGGRVVVNIVRPFFRTATRQKYLRRLCWSCAGILAPTV